MSDPAEEQRGDGGVRPFLSGLTVDLDAIFDPAAYLTHAGEVFDRLEGLRG